MSVQALSWAFQIEIPPSPKIVLLAIADHADSAGKNAFPSIERLARMTSMSESTVKRWVARLQELGVISITHGGGRGHSNHYTLCMDAVVSMTREEIGRLTASPELRREVIETGQRTCYWCHEQGDTEMGPDGRPWHCDRLRSGGQYVLENVVLSCATCNQSKGVSMTSFGNQVSLTSFGNQVIQDAKPGHPGRETRSSRAETRSVGDPLTVNQQRTKPLTPVPDLFASEQAGRVEEFRALFLGCGSVQRSRSVWDEGLHRLVVIPGVTVTQLRSVIERAKREWGPAVVNIHPRSIADNWEALATPEAKKTNGAKDNGLRTGGAEPWMQARFKHPTREDWDRGLTPDERREVMRQMGYRNEAEMVLHREVGGPWRLDADGYVTIPERAMT